eukprot:m.194876 g.194876  ORF g.194876 m.194876 type:complete len:348 (-) comp13662_c0_seq9:4359-5402(-)
MGGLLGKSSGGKHGGLNNEELQRKRQEVFVVGESDGHGHTSEFNIEQQKKLVHQDVVSSVQYSDNHILSTALNKTYALIDLSSLSNNVMQLSQQPLDACFVSNDVAVIGCRNGSVLFCDLTIDGSPNLTAIDEHNLAVQAVASTGVSLCSGSKDGEVKFWDAERAAVLRDNKISRNVVTGLSSLSEHTFAQSSEDRCLRVWDSRTGAVSVEFQKQRYIMSCCSCMDEHLIVTGSRGAGTNTDGCIISLWDTRNNSESVGDFSGHNGSVSDCVFTDSNHFLSSSNDDTLRLWDMSATACVDVFSCPSAPTCVASSSRTGLFCVGLSNGQVLQGKVDDSTHKVTSVSAL